MSPTNPLRVLAGLALAVVVLSAVAYVRVATPATTTVVYVPVPCNCTPCAHPSSAASPPSSSSEPQQQQATNSSASGAVGVCARGITRVIHQSWKTEELPEWSKGFVASWRRVYPPESGWRWALHTDADNRRIFARVFPQHLDAYDRSQAIVRADLTRAAYLYDEGGVYGDLDTEAIKPLDGLMEEGCRLGRPVILGRMDGPVADHDHAIPNALMITSQPGEAFWPFCVARWAHNIRTGCGIAESCAGPMALRGCLVAWAQDKGGDKTLVDFKPAERIWLQPKGVLYPHSWMYQGRLHECTHGSIDPDKCKSKVDMSQALTMVYWRHSWRKRMLMLSAAEEPSRGPSQ
eukprot:m51a1_g7288 hypothetical protein (348) ;mRNA; f:46475-47767